jgi:hypothetical protein
MRHSTNYDIFTVAASGSFVNEVRSLDERREMKNEGGQRSLPTYNSGRIVI